VFIIGFDIETAKPAPLDRNAQIDEWAIGITCMGISSWNGTEFTTSTFATKKEDGSYAEKMSIDDLKSAFDRLSLSRAFGIPVGFNSLGFDLRVLAAELRDTDYFECIRNFAWHHIDPFFQMLCSEGFGCGMKAFAAGFEFRDGKMPDMDGMQAVELWKADRERVMQYVGQDAELTIKIYESIRHTRQYRWVTQKGKHRNRTAPIKSLPALDGSILTRLLRIRECLTLNVPDTSWMTDPITREQCSSWLEVDYARNNC